MRSRDPKRLSSPWHNEFVEVAEIRKSDVMEEMGQWPRDTDCGQVRQLASAARTTRNTRTNAVALNSKIADRRVK
jgi:hypothetical protein